MKLPELRARKPKSEPVLQVSRNLDAIMVERHGHECICEHCGQRFVTVRTDARYCSNAHRQAAYRERR